MVCPPPKAPYVLQQLTCSSVYTQQDILAKHKGKPPSLRVYLHPKHFRLNDSQETLSYASPMRELLQAIKDKVVPHNMVEELYEFNTPWYDNCLIVEVHDYRSSGVKPKDDANNTGEGSTNAFSIHNYNSFITPSPYAPFPVNKPEQKPTQPPAQSKDGDAKEDKENMPAPGQNGTPNKQAGLGKVRTVVLFPTPLSHLADIQLLATTPVPDMAALKRMQAQGRAAGMPPTPLTGVPSTPTFPNGPSPKRQKMVLDDSNLHEFEAEVLNNTCPPLYLEPTKSFGESLALMDAITHPNNKNPAPPRKTRKRTTAELAADEAEAQGLQRFMLAGDEFQSVMAAAATGNDDNAVRAAANSQTFARFKTIANIRANHEENDRRKKEEDARIAQAKRQAQMEAELQRKRELESRQQAEVAERQQAALRQQAQHQAQLQQNQLQQTQLQQNEALRAAAAAQHQMASAAAAQVTQTPQSATQSQFSPTIRQQTPMTASAASPRVGGQASHPIGGTPMVPSASNQAINSPARPPSSISHHQNQMARSISQQQNPSRTGTPHIVQGTPVMNPSMPNRNMTPTPSRMNQNSPSMAMQGQTPMMMQTPQPGQNMTPEAMQQLRVQQMRMQQLQQQGGSPGNQQQQMQQMAFQKAQQHIQQTGVPPNQNPQAYRQQLAQHYFRQLQQQHQNQQQQQQQMGMQNMSSQGAMPQNAMPQQGMAFANMSLQQMRLRYQQQKATVMQNYSNTQSIPPQIMQQMQHMELQIKQREQREQQQAQMAQMQNGMGNQMNGGQMGGMQNANPANPMQMQQYQQLLQQQRQAAANQNRIMQMRQQAMANGGQLPQGMMGNMNAMGGMQGTMQGMNAMGNMGNVQGMNMGQMGQMNGGMGGMQNGQMNTGMQGMQNMQGMQGMNQMNQMNQQQMQQMMMMRQAQQQAQRMGQPGGQQGGDMGWTG